MIRAWRTSSYKENNGSPLSRVSSTHTCKQYSTGGEHTCNNEASEQAVPPRLAMLRAWRASSYIENDGSPAKTSPEANIASEHGINNGMRREFQRKGSFFISESRSYRETVHGSPPKTSAEENIASEKEINEGKSPEEGSRFITKTLSFRESVSRGPPKTLFSAGDNIASELEKNEGKSPQDSFYISSPGEQDVLIDEEQIDQDALRKCL